MNISSNFPEDFKDCVRFHGHVCPGLAIGYAAAKAARRALGVPPSVDEEVVAMVENDSCAVDAIQVILGCTLGKGNLVLRDWGKQVFTVIDRKSGRSVRVSFTGAVPNREERHALRLKIDSGLATDEEKRAWEALGVEAVSELISGDPARFFEVREVASEIPPMAEVVNTQPCEICGEPVKISRIVDKEGRRICVECAGPDTEGRE